MLRFDQGLGRGRETASKEQFEDLLHDDHNKCKDEEEEGVDVQKGKLPPRNTVSRNHAEQSTIMAHCILNPVSTLLSRRHATITHDLGEALGIGPESVWLGNANTNCYKR